MFKVETIEQFKILDFIKNNFVMDAINLEPLDGYSIKITDKKGDSMVFIYSDGEILSK